MAAGTRSRSTATFEDPSRDGWELMARGQVMSHTDLRPHAAGRICLAAAVVAAVAALHAQVPSRPPETLPAAAVDALRNTLAAARPHARHVWRDTPPRAGEDVRVYVEIARGDARKWELDMRAHARQIDRVMPADVGPYPVNYGFVPQTVAWDGDPFDALVLGPPVTGGSVVRGVVVGLMLMEDEKGIDSKVVLSPRGADGRAAYALSANVRERIANYFGRYKRHQPGKFSRVPGWGSVDEGRRHVEVTHAFFTRCRESRGACRLPVAGR